MTAKNLPGIGVAELAESSLAQWQTARRNSGEFRYTRCALLHNLARLCLREANSIA